MFAGLLDTFNSAGLKGLRNGLGEPDNERLMQSDDVDEIVALVVQGLRCISER